jgi:hypothetical protein
MRKNRCCEQVIGPGAPSSHQTLIYSLDFGPFWVVFRANLASEYGMSRAYPSVEECTWTAGTMRRVLHS